MEQNYKYKRVAEIRKTERVPCRPTHSDERKKQLCLVISHLDYLEW